MDKIVNIKTVGEYNEHWGVENRHPLVNVFEGSQIMRPIPNCRKNFDLYVIFLKDVKCADYLKYGRKEYDYQENTLVFVSPGQVFGYPADGSTYQAKGWCLYFSPELLRGTQLGRHIKDYTFFSYDVREALHLSLQERETIIDCLKKIDDEINNGMDKHSNMIIASAIELFLNYCTRFYDRQFITRKKANKDILARFEELLDGYFASDKPQSYGTPSVAYCAEQLHLSANYFGDLIKKETGKSAQEYVQQKIMDTAKDMLANLEKSVSEIAYALGYQYPQYFSRAFKKVVGCTPNEYRMAE
ncbi:helix-turn-helix domain-containing protein [Butyricimonas synergistica]|uniref:helix-turn-helix domain-containing protein n=1 Tax=Butyricimonas synergistica TaxID=544644 RepID=UPI000380E629|nr:helix-turn-helix domain-containing protein [Butyricimonas synergistica]